MIEAFPDQYTTENTTVTVYKDSYSRANRGPIWRHHYCPLLKLSGNGLGTLSTLVDTRTMEAKIEDFEVWIKDERTARGRRGLGTLLMQSSIAHLKKVGCTSVFSEDVNQKALRVRNRIFPDNAMQFTDAENPQCRELPMTTQQAIGSADRIASLNHAARLTGSDRVITNFGIKLDLSLVDTTDWPVAVDLETYRAQRNAA